MILNFYEPEKYGKKIKPKKVADSRIVTTLPPDYENRRQLSEEHQRELREEIKEEQAQVVTVTQKSPVAPVKSNRQDDKPRKKRPRIQKKNGNNNGHQYSKILPDRMRSKYQKYHEDFPFDQERKDAPVDGFNPDYVETGHHLRGNVQERTRDEVQEKFRQSRKRAFDPKAPENSAELLKKKATYDPNKYEIEDDEDDGYVRIRFRT